jgi:integrative and conjugative element protein (TIGR02256 family)
VIEYEVGASGQVLVFTLGVLDRFRRYRQLRLWQKEAGGQLFATFDSPRIVIVEATGPRRSDLRTRTTYAPDRVAEQREIAEMRARGLHYVGDWHTHPEKVPTPSWPDETSIADCFGRSTHGLNAFVLVVVGTAGAPDGLHVAIHNADSRLLLEPMVVRESSTPKRRA